MKFQEYVKKMEDFDVEDGTLNVVDVSDDNWLIDFDVESGSVNVEDICSDEDGSIKFDESVNGRLWLGAMYRRTRDVLLDSGDSESDDDSPSASSSRKHLVDSFGCPFSSSKKTERVDESDRGDTDFNFAYGVQKSSKKEALKFLDWEPKDVQCMEASLFPSFVERLCLNMQAKNSISELLSEDEHHGGQRMLRSAESIGSILPRDIVIEILKRCPVKCLLRLRVVCKDWYAIIGSKTFTEGHFDERRPALIVQCMGSSEETEGGSDDMNVDFVRLVLYNQKECELVQHSILAGFPKKIHTMLGPTRGIFFVASYLAREFNICLWNLSTRRCRNLPSPSPDFCEFDIFGFGIDCHGFKAVVIHAQSAGFSVYSSVTNKWKHRSSSTLLCHAYLDTFLCKGIFAKGFFYWIQRHTRPHQTVPYESSLLAFNMDNDSFETVRLPIEVRHDVFIEDMAFDDTSIARHQATLHLQDEALAFMCFDYHAEECQPSFLRVWVLTGDTAWTHIMTIQLSGGLRGQSNALFDGHFIALLSQGVEDDQGISVYSFNTNTVGTFRIKDTHRTVLRNVLIYSYKESLFSLEEDCHHEEPDI